VSKQNIEFYLSGGAANTDPNLSLGGARSLTPINGIPVTFTGGGIAGVSLNHASGCASGLGELHYFTSPPRMCWVGAEGVGNLDLINQTEIVGDGVYIIPDRNGVSTITVSIVALSLPSIDVSELVTIGVATNNLFGATTPQDAESGKTQYRCIYALNTSGKVLTIDWWLGLDMSSADGVSLGLSGLVSGVIEETIVDEETAPLAPTFYKRFSGGSLNLTINAGESIGVWLRLHTPVLSEGLTKNDFGSITFLEV